ncbi:MAG: Nramp family divalent metal transporter, partial [Planctomycetota bacterium]
MPHTTPPHTTPPPRRRQAGWLGPGLLVTAAFIGPGTILMASKAGASHGCDLLWTIVLATFGAIVLQHSAARLGILSGHGLGAAIRHSLRGTPWFPLIVALVLVAIGIGNAAYQTGNINGAVAGVCAISGISDNHATLAFSVVAALVILVGRDLCLRRILVSLVVLLSVTFLLTAMMTLPSLSAILQGLAVPMISVDHLSLIIGMIGTTIVPYNLFLHASASADAWTDESIDERLRRSARDTTLSIGLGGLVTASILLTAVTAFHERGESIESLTQIGEQLRPILGRYSHVAFCIGIIAAGLTSALTAPVATAYAVCGCMGWETNLSNWRFRGIALTVVVIGCLCGLV